MGRLVKVLIAAHVLLIVVVVALSQAFGNNADTGVGDWAGLVLIYILVFALPATITTVLLAALLRRLVPAWRRDRRWADIVALVVVPAIAALVIGVTNDGDRHGWQYLSWPALLAVVSVGICISRRWRRQH
jgi:cation transport ATPase